MSLKLNEKNIMFEVWFIIPFLIIVIYGLF